MARLHLVLGVFAVALTGCGAMDAGEILGATKSALLTCGASPGPEEVLFYAQDGRCYVGQRGFSQGELYPQGGSLPNDALVSVRLGSAVRAVIFSDHFFNGTKTILVNDTSGLPHNTSSYRVEYRTDTCEVPSFRPPASAITIYRDGNFSGDCAVLHSTDPNNFGHPGLLYETVTGLPNDSISSAYIGPFTSATFYRDDSAFDADHFPLGPSQSIPNTTSVPQGYSNFGSLNIGNDQVSAVYVKAAF